MRAVLHLLRDDRVRAAFLILWAVGWGITLYMSLRPLQLPPDVSDKLLHVGGYALLTLVAAGFCRAPAVFLALAASTVAGSALVECLQGLLPYRSFEWLDIAANATGASLGGLMGVAWLLLLLRMRPLSRPSPS